MSRGMVLLFIFLAGGSVGLGLIYWAYTAGRDVERAENLRKAVELVKERDKIDAKLKTATPADICHRLGGEWLPDKNECG